MPSYPLQNFAVAVITVTPIVAACVVALRLYARRSDRKPFGWDDYLITLASFLSLLLIYPSIKVLYMWHMGVHIWQVNPEHLGPDPMAFYKIQLVFNLIYTPILPLVKASIILLLIKVAWVVDSIKRVLYVILAFNALACVGPMVCLIFLCQPATGENAEDKPPDTVFNGLKCLDTWQAAIVYLFLVSVNLVTDVLICPIPTLVIYRLYNISLRSRISMIVCFALSLSATAIGALRFKVNYDTNLLSVSPSDWTYNINFVLKHAENNTAIILACLPPLRAFFVSLASNSDEESRAPLPRPTQTSNQTLHWESFSSQTLRWGSFLSESRPPPEGNNNSSTNKTDSL